MTKFKYIWVDILGGNIYWIRCPRAEYEKRVRREFEMEAPKKEARIKATFEVYHKDEQPIGVVWFSNHSKEYMIHECFHATHWICATQGIWLTDSS